MSGKDQIIREIFKPARRNFIRRKVVLKSRNDLLQVDLAQFDELARENDSFKYILVCINCFTKFLYCRKLKDKKASSTAKVMREILEESERQLKLPIKNCQSDDGTEFKGEFYKLMKEKGINFYHTYSDLKASIVERAIKTLKNNLYKEMAKRGTYRYIDFLDETVDKYNNETVHSTIQMTPKLAMLKRNEKKLLETVYNYERKRVKTRFEAGDFVRISNKKFVFSRGFHPQFTPEIFKIAKVNNKYPPTYKLQDYEGKEILGTFYEPEMTKVKDPSLYLVEKVLKTKGNRQLVKWLGFDDSHNSWIDKNDFI